MFDFIKQLADAEKNPVFCADSAGNVCYTNPAGEAFSPAKWSGRTLRDCLPQFLPEEKLIDYESMTRTKTFFSREKPELLLEIIPLSGFLFCRIIPFPEEKSLSPDQLSDQLFKIRESIAQLFAANEQTENEMYDLMDLIERRLEGEAISFTAGTYQPFFDLLHQSNLSGRKTLLSCNRLEIAMGDFSFYPAQRIDLLRTVQALRRQISEILPPLKAPLSWNLPEKGKAEIAFNRRILSWTILEALRSAEISSNVFGATVLINIGLQITEDKAVLCIQENCLLLAGDKEPPPQPERQIALRVMREAAAAFHAEVSFQQLDYGDYQTEIRFPLLSKETDENPPSTLELRSPVSYRFSDDLLEDDILVYLEPFIR